MNNGSSTSHRAFTLSPLALVAITSLMLAGGDLHRARAAEPEKAPPPGADSAAKLLARFSEAVDRGDAADARACLETSTAGGKNYAAFVGKLAELNGARRKLLEGIEKKHGAEVKAQAAPLLGPSFGAAGNPYAGLGTGVDDFKEGSKIQLPGWKGPAVLVRKDAVWLLDPAEVLSGVDLSYVDKDLAREIGYIADCTKAADTAGSGKELIEKIQAVVRK